MVKLRNRPLQLVGVGSSEERADSKSVRSFVCVSDFRKKEKLMDEMIKMNLTQRGMAQFERLHSPVEETEDTEVTIICKACDEDWPCQRMSIVLISQALAMLQSMLPTGNLQSVLQRFSSLQK
jgi:hypothetical protein